MSKDKIKLRCAKCDEELSPANTVFGYMGMSFAHDVLRCPKCHGVFISKDLADGRMAEVEKMMEEK